MHVSVSAPPDFDARMRRISMLLYGVAIISIWLLANLPLGDPAIQRRPLNLVALFACVSLLAVWCFPWQRFHRNLFLMMTFSALTLVAIAVAASGGWRSPLSLLYLFAVLFNSAYYARALALLLDGGVVLWSISPVLYQADIAALLAHLIVFGSLCFCIGFVADLMMREVRQREHEVGALVAQQRQRARELDRLTALHRAGVAVSAELDAQRVMETVVHELAVSLGYRFVGIYLRDGDTHFLRAQIGFAAPLERIGAGEGVIGRVCRTGRSVLVEDVHADADYLAIDPVVRSEVCAPILHDRTVIGVINIESSERLDRGDLEVLELFAQQVSAALANAEIHAAMTRLAQRDALTQILNRGALLANLEQSIAETAETGRSLALLYLDLDDFKRLNDRHGHAFGDEILRTCVREIEAILTPTTTFGRYGGEEFLVVLPGADQHQGLAIAEAIRARIAACRFPEPDDDGAASVTVSIGVATIPENATTIPVLLTRADQALYAAKASGGNRAMSRADVDAGDAWQWQRKLSAVNEP